MGKKGNVANALYRNARMGEGENICGRTNIEEN
jgi:hypothetical protein